MMGPSRELVISQSERELIAHHEIGHALAAIVLGQEILDKVSRGLTKTEKNGRVVPDIAEKWKIAPSGKAYAFILNLFESWYVSVHKPNKLTFKCGRYFVYKCFPAIINVPIIFCCFVIKQGNNKCFFCRFR